MSDGMVTVTLSRQDLLTALAALDMTGHMLGQFADWGHEVYADYDVAAEEPEEVVEPGAMAYGADRVNNVRGRLLDALRQADEDAGADESGW